MRDYIVLGFFFLSAPLALFVPYYGVLIWYLITVLNPHRFAWSLAYDFPVAMLIGIPTIIGAVFSRERTQKFFTREAVILLLLWAWFCITTIHAAQTPFLSTHVGESVFKLTRISKILLMTFVTLYLINTKQKLRTLLLLVALCFAFLDGKGAIFAFATGGQYRVYGPEQSFIEDNNAFGLASNMVMPLMFFLAMNEPKRWMRTLLRAGFLSAIVAVMLTYSRGGLLGLAAVLAGVAVKTRRKLLGLALVVVVGIGALAYSPEKWQERMSGFLHGQVDGSAEQRLITWQVGLRLIKDYPLFGGGFEVYPDIPIFQHYKPREMPGGRLSNGPHSIYFEMLGEHGLVGLGLFLALIGSTLFSLRRVIRVAKRDPDGAWALNTANGLELGIYAFLMSGTFLGFANFDLWYLYVACTTMLHLLYMQELRLSSQPRQTPSFSSEDPDRSSEPVGTHDGLYA